MKPDQPPPLNWGDLCRSLLGDAWLSLLAKSDTKIPRRNMNHMRAEQRAMEGSYLASFSAPESRLVALELIALYHLAAAAERLAVFIGEGHRDKEAVQELFDEHFSRALEAGKDAGANELIWLCLQLQTQVSSRLRGDEFSAPPKLVALLQRWSGKS